MIDPKLLRQSANEVAENLARRNFEFDAGTYVALEEQRKLLQVDVESLRAEKNTSAKSVGKAKAQGEDPEPLLAAVKDLGDRLDKSEGELQSIQSELLEIELSLPNLLHDDVPSGADESDNVEVLVWGDLPEFEFEVRDHVDLGAGL
jgi:seryl-tRNA synthetase